MEDFILMLISTVSPSILSAIVIYQIGRMRKGNEARDEMRREECVLILENLDAIGGLAEQTARCAKGEKLNGELQMALDYRKDRKHALEKHLLKVNAESR